MKRYFPALALALAMTSAASAQDLVVHARTLYTMEGPAIENGVVVVRGGKIVAAGPAASVTVPGGARELRAAVVTPGLIDAHSVVGLAGYLNQDHDQDQLDRSAPLQPELRAIDSYNPHEPLIEWLRSFGITTLHTGHAPAAVISGQTMVVKTRGTTLDSALIQPVAMISATLGEAALAGSGKSPGTRSKEVALLRTMLLKADDYRKKRAAAAEDKRPARDLQLESLATVLAGERPLLVTAHRAHDIVTALRLAKEFNIRIVLDGAAEAYLVAEEIKRAGVPVILHPTMTRSEGDLENVSFETAAVLQKRGIPVALQGGYETYVPKTRVVLFEAAAAAANGLSAADALAAITINTARLLGIADRVGSLAPGKDADLVLFDGDPFEYTSHVTGVVIDGEVVSEKLR